jgi:signal transduction histidine kinase
MIRLSFETFGEVSDMMTLGKLVHGLIHNLNSPLQSLLMDMDMIRLLLKDHRTPPAEVIEDVEARFARMEDEFEHINRLIRTAAARIPPDEDEKHLFLDDFLAQEIAFLKADLHFKHRVESETSLEEGLPRLRTLAPGVPPAIRSLLAAVVEDMGRRNLDAFYLEAGFNGPGIEIVVCVGTEGLSDIFLDPGLHLSQADGAEVSRENMAALQAFINLERAGVSYTAERKSHGTRITLTLTRQNPVSP